MSGIMGAVNTGEIAGLIRSAGVISASVRSGGGISGAVGSGSVILNDYRITTEKIEGGHRLTVSRGNDVQMMDIMDGAGGALVPATAEVLGGIRVGENLSMDANGVLSVDTATAAEADNTRPITSAAVQTQIGNIGVLLATI